jgi:hypothetical protein
VFDDPDYRDTIEMCHGCGVLRLPPAGARLVASRIPLGQGGLLLEVIVSARSELTGKPFMK